MNHRDLPAEQAAAVLNYPRRRKTGPGMFAGWYISIGGINIFLGLATLSFAVFSIFNAIAGWLQGPGGAFQFPAVAMILSLFAITTSCLLIVGSVASFRRLRWSRKVVRAGLAGDLTVCLGALVGLLMMFNQLPTSLEFEVGAGIIFRVGWLVFALKMYSNMRADFYFEPVPTVEQQSQVVPISMPMNAPKFEKAPPGGGFEIVGFDSTTFKPVYLTSRAPTEALARKFALTMGVAEDTMHITAIGTGDAGKG